MADVKARIREGEACAPQPMLLWDTVWIQEPIILLTAQGGYGDWQIGAGDETGNVGGLQAKAALHTATLICLFTDRRAPDDQPLDSDDPRGWWGDGIPFSADPYDRELGSHLWLLECGLLSEQTAAIAKEMAEVALSVLKEQGAVARTEVEASAFPQDGRLEIGVRHFAQDGATLYDQRFGIAWGQIAKYPGAQELRR